MPGQGYGPTAKHRPGMHETWAQSLHCKTKTKVNVCVSAHTCAHTSMELVDGQFSKTEQEGERK